MPSHRVPGHFEPHYPAAYAALEICSACRIFRIWALYQAFGKLALVRRNRVLQSFDNSQISLSHRGGLLRV